MESIGSDRIKTAAYHPAANGMIERFHHQLKNSLKCEVKPEEWTQNLPLILLGIPTQTKEDTSFSPAEALYGQPLSLPAT
jgi:cleavage and polyadenylation specificity factor subunit 1